MLVDTIYHASALVALFGFASIMFAWAGWTDIRTMRIPNLASLGLVLAWIARAILAPDTVSLIGDPLFFLSVFAIFFLLYATAGGGFGAGDVKLISAGALWFGWSASPVRLTEDADFLSVGVIFLATLAIAGLVQSLGKILLDRFGHFIRLAPQARDNGGKLRIPYGPSIVAGAAAAMAAQAVSWGIF